MSTYVSSEEKKSPDEILARLESWLRLEVSQGDPSPNTLRCYLCSARSYLKWCEDKDASLLKATQSTIKAYRRFLVLSGYRRGTVATRLSGVKRLYAALVDWGWIDTNPAISVRAKHDLTSQSERIIAKYIPDRVTFLNLFKLPNDNTLIGKRDRAILRILCYTGIRVSELCALECDDLHLGDLPTLTIRAGKGRKRRQIPLGEDDANILREWRTARNTVNCLDQNAVFISLDNRTRGSRLSTRGARTIVDKYLIRAGIKKPGRSCHALRHSTATWLLAADVPMQVIADLLGHSSLDVTAIYARVVEHRKYTPGDILAKIIRETKSIYRPGMNQSIIANQIFH